MTINHLPLIGYNRQVIKRISPDIYSITISLTYGILAYTTCIPREQHWILQPCSDCTTRSILQLIYSPSSNINGHLNLLERHSRFLSQKTLLRAGRRPSLDDPGPKPEIKQRQHNTEQKLKLYINSIKRETMCISRICDLSFYKGISLITGLQVGICYYLPNFKGSVSPKRSHL